MSSDEEWVDNGDMMEDSEGYVDHDNVDDYSESDGEMDYGELEPSSPVANLRKVICYSCMQNTC